MLSNIQFLRAETALCGYKPPEENTANGARRFAKVVCHTQTLLGLAIRAMFGTLRFVKTALTGSMPTHQVGSLDHGR